ncbi:MAG: type II toxin-antitoxin system RelE/ParE family toxin [Microbacterium sp.]
MIGRRAVTSQRADEDIAAAIAHYLSENAEPAALDVVDALAELPAPLGAYTSMGSTRFRSEIGLDGLRSVALKRFPYVFYTDDVDVVRIQRMLHTWRDIPEEFAAE